jgi:hypothetical protein
MGTLDGDDIELQDNSEDTNDDDEEKQEKDLDLQSDPSFEKDI